MERFETSTDKPCTYTKIVGTVPVRDYFLWSFGSATEAVPFRNVPFGSLVNGRNCVKTSEKGIDGKIFFAILLFYFVWTGLYKLFC